MVMTGTITPRGNGLSARSRVVVGRGTTVIVGGVTRGIVRRGLALYYMLFLQWVRQSGYDI